MWSTRSGGSARCKHKSTPAVRLAVWVRTEGVTASEFDQALATDRTVVRTWLMRSTLHLVAAEDLGWMVDLLGPIVRARSHRRREQLGLTDELCERALAALPEALAAAGPMPLRQVMAKLADHGVRIDTSDQAPTHLMVLAATHGIVCRGPEAGREPTFARSDEWVTPGPRLDRDESLARLARLYLAGRGPATVADFATWSSLPAAEARRGFDVVVPDLVQVEVAGTAMVAPADMDLGPPHQTSPRLIGLWDEYLLSSRSRDLILDPAVAHRILVGGVIQSTLLVEGRVAGLWRLRGSGGRRKLDVEPFADLSRSTQRAVVTEARDIGRFLGAQVEVA